MTLFTERHADKISGVLSCFDRIVITGTIPHICFAQGMTAFLKANDIRIFDYPRWAEPLREEIRVNAERLAKENGLEIEFLRKKKFRKEDRIANLLEKRGTHPGLVHIFSAMEPCPSYRPWHDKQTGQTSLKPTDGKCLHYYFYFILEDLGLCYVRVPTWAPFRLQFYYNGHNELAARLRKKGIAFKLLDNVFAEIQDFPKAQDLALAIDPQRLHRRLDQVAKTYCPVISQFADGYHWSLMQVEFAMDIVFRAPTKLQPIYQELVRTAVHAVKADNVATFLGRKVTGQFDGEVGNDFHTRVEGTRIKHFMDSAAIKMYDKHGFILRIETVANNVSFFKHYREVEHRDRTSNLKFAPVKKTIYSLPVLVELMQAANRRYLEFISAIDDPTSCLRDLDKISKPTQDGERSWRGFNLFQGEDLDLFQSIIRGEYNISGIRNSYLQTALPGKTAHQISRMIKRLRKHGLLKKIGSTYKYYLTALGRKITAAALKLREMTIIPLLRGKLAPVPL